MATYTREEVVATARQMLGVRYQHQGRSRESGVDCIGLLWAIADALGDEPHDFRRYARKPCPRVLLEHAAVGMQAIEAEGAGPGDVLLFWFQRDRETRLGIPTHFGVITDAGTLIHAYAPSEMVIEQPLDAFWKRRVYGAYRLRGLVVSEPAVRWSDG